MGQRLSFPAGMRGVTFERRSAFQITHPVWSEIAVDVRLIQSQPNLSRIYQLHRETTSENASGSRWIADCIYELHYSQKWDVLRIVYSWVLVW